MSVLRRDRMRWGNIFGGVHKYSSRAFIRAVASDSVRRYTIRARFWDTVGSALARVGL